MPVKLSRQSPIGAVVAVGLAAALALAGCTTGASSSGGSATDSSSTTDAPSTDSGLSGYVGMPETFPADVPVIEGDVLFGVDLGTGWSIVVQADDPAAAYTDASAKLTTAGYTADVSSTSDDGSFGSFIGTEYTVQVTATDSVDYGPSVQYTVIKNV